MSYKEDMKNVIVKSKDATNFGALLLRLTMKADLHNRALLKKAFPNAVEVVKYWRETGECLELPYD